MTEVEHSIEINWTGGTSGAYGLIFRTRSDRRPATGARVVLVHDDVEIAATVTSTGYDIMVDVEGCDPSARRARTMRWVETSPLPRPRPRMVSAEQEPTVPKRQG